jgi:lysophospholipase L1-like esterase
VFAHAATVLIVAFGTNDIGWGVYADEGHKQAYLDAVYFKQGDLPAELAKLAVASDEQLEANQRAVAQPRPYRFVIEPAMPDKKQKK